MSRPEDIPQDVWEAAERPVWLAVHSSLPMQVEVARAIMAERERCAKVADEQASREEYGHAKHAAVTIAQIIRSPESGT